MGAKVNVECRTADRTDLLANLCKMDCHIGEPVDPVDREEGSIFSRTGFRDRARLTPCNQNQKAFL